MGVGRFTEASLPKPRTQLSDGFAAGVRDGEVWWVFSEAGGSELSCLCWFDVSRRLIFWRRIHGLGLRVAVSHSLTPLCGCHLLAVDYKSLLFL